MKSDMKKGSDSLLKHSNVATRLPVQDLGRARLFYSEKLGLDPIEERPGGLLYRCKSGSFALFISSGASSGDFTQMAFEVTDLRATVKALRARGVVFEAYDLPGLKTMEGIAEVEGNYPSKGGVHRTRHISRPTPRAIIFLFLDQVNFIQYRCGLRRYGRW